MLRRVSAVLFGFALFGMFAAIHAADVKGTAMSPLSYKMKGIDGKEVDLAAYKGKVVMIVNVASKCGATKQYAGLEALYDKYGKDGLVVIGVPANDFGKQEPGSDEEIAKFCSATYDVSFPMLAKVPTIVGENKVELYKTLTTKGGEVKWNFTKFLIGRDGQIAARFDTQVTPEDKELVAAVETELAKK